jgi:FkbM family methyltransferase
MRLYCFSESNEKNRIIKLAEWETDEVIFKKEFQKIQKGWTVVDVGSEFGYYAIKAAFLVGNGGKVLAIEANPKTYQVLKMNIKLYELTNRIIPVCKAAGKESGKATLCEAASVGGSSIVSSHLPDLDRKRINSWLEFLRRGAIFKIIVKKYAPVKYIVSLDTLDKIVKEYNIRKIDLIKIDVEGAELDVLEGSRVILEKDRPILLVEVHFGCGWEPETLYELLERFGYSLTIEKRTHKALVVAHPGGYHQN